MLTLAIKTLIILLGIFRTPGMPSHASTFIFLFLAVTTSALNQYYNIHKLTFTLAGGYIILALFYPSALAFAPVLFFDLATHLPLKYTAFLPLVFIVANNESGHWALYHVLVGFIALILSHMLVKIEHLDIVNKEIRDTNALQKKSLITKNKELLERQNDEIHMMKLTERNRIARDIHDTIGHALSRALLQTGALSAINESTAVQSAINELKETLTNSMNSIRNSVHDLKDEGIDLKSSILQILKGSGFKFSFSFDVENEVPNEIKNCFFLVLKEAITNTTKHSNATQIVVTIIEHPAMYQILIADNGTKEPTQVGHGIGLRNIFERVDELGGYCRINYQLGFRIFITVSK